MTACGIPDNSATRSDSIIRFIANALPVSLWHAEQWQQSKYIGWLSSRYRTALHEQPP
jgi:hypothetical protein